MKRIGAIVSAAIAVLSAAGGLWLSGHGRLFGGNTIYVVGGLMLTFLISAIISFLHLVALMDRRRAVRGLQRQGPPPDHEAVAGKLREIEAELKRLGLWQSEPLRPEQYGFSRPYAMDTMSFEQWLQFVFIPRVEMMLYRNEQFPPRSSVAAHAVREFDGRDECDSLCSLLSQFDRLF